MSLLSTTSVPSKPTLLPLQPSRAVLVEGSKAACLPACLCSTVSGPASAPDTPSGRRQFPCGRFHLNRPRGCQACHHRSSASHHCVSIPHGHRGLVPTPQSLSLCFWLRWGESSSRAPVGCPLGNVHSPNGRCCLQDWLPSRTGNLIRSHTLICVGTGEFSGHNLQRKCARFSLLPSTNRIRPFSRCLCASPHPGCSRLQHALQAPNAAMGAVPQATGRGVLAPHTHRGFEFPEARVKSLPLYTQRRRSHL